MVTRLPQGWVRRLGQMPTLSTDPALACFLNEMHSDQNGRGDDSFKYIYIYIDISVVNYFMIGIATPVCHLS